MSTLSCINHPKEEPILVLHDWQTEFCDYDEVAVGLISIFEYWHNIKLKKQRGKPKKLRRITDLYQFHSEKSLIRKLLFITKTPACIRRSIAFLVKKGVITIHKNPSKNYAFDRTRHFLFHPDAVNNWLKKRENDKEEINEILIDEPSIESQNVPKMDTQQAKKSPATAINPTKPVISSSEKPPIVEKKTGEIVFDFALKNYSLTEQANIHKILANLTDSTLQQTVLDECNQALSTGKVKNVLAYLAALVERANKGKFCSTAQLAQQRSLAIQKTPLNSPPPALKQPHELFPSCPNWKEKQEEIKAMLKLSDYMSFVLPIRAYQGENTLFLRCPNVYSSTFITKIKKQMETLFRQEIKIYTA